jgi:hypothetical protein
VNLLAAMLRSSKGRIILLVIAGIIGWQVWLTLAAPGKIAPSLPGDAQRVDVLVTLPFPAERFHIQELQKYGRVSGTRDTSVEVRGVNRANLRAVARPFWVRRVEPLQQEG